MKRPIGVTAGVVVALLGSILALMFAAAGVASLFLQKPPGAETPPVVSVGIMALIVAVIAGVGVWTAVGLFQLRPWARTSIQVLALFVAIGCAFSLLILTVTHLPPDITQDTRNAAHIGMGIMFGTPLLLAAWILFQFNTASTKAAFASGATVDPSPRPLSITFIAWSTFLSFAAFVGGAIVGGPGFLLGLTLSSWLARLYDMALAALCFYIGKGLLELRERARVVAVGWSLFTLLNTAVVFIPSVRQRIIGAHVPPAPTTDTAFPVSVATFLEVSFGAMAIGAAITIWFLEHHRDVFVRTENSRFLARLHQG